LVPAVPGWDFRVSIREEFLRLPARKLPVRIVPKADRTFSFTGWGETVLPEISDTGKVQEKTIEDEDAGFVDRCRRGETEAFSVLVRKYQKKMLNIAFRMIGDYEEACDVVQEAFLACYRAIGKFRGEARFSTWLCGIVLNRTRTFLKQKANRRQREGISIDDSEGLKTDLVSLDESAEQRLERQELEIRIQKCLGTLDHDQREVVILRDIQDFSYEAIGQTLKLPLGTVRSRLFRGRVALKDCLVKRKGPLR
jgi:RNA polymerase sigma-70 factor (ECF subfamily)